MKQLATYTVGLDREITAGEETYYVNLSASVGFDSEGEAREMEIEFCDIEGSEEGNMVPWQAEGRAIEKVVAEGLPTLTKAIDDALWKEIRQFAEDNAHDIIVDIDMAEDDCRL